MGANCPTTTTPPPRIPGCARVLIDSDCQEQKNAFCLGTFRATSFLQKPGSRFVFLALSIDSDLFSPSPYVRDDDVRPADDTIESLPFDHFAPKLVARGFSKHNIYLQGTRHSPVVALGVRISDKFSGPTCTCSLSLLPSLVTTPLLLP